jgi:hypothetical protein
MLNVVMLNVVAHFARIVSQISDSVEIVTSAKKVLLYLPQDFKGNQTTVFFEKNELLKKIFLTCYCIIHGVWMAPRHSV